MLYIDGDSHTKLKRDVGEYSGPRISDQAIS